LNHGGVKNDNTDRFDVAEINAKVLGGGFELSVCVKIETFAVSVIGPSGHDENSKS